MRISNNIKYLLAYVTIASVFACKSDDSDISDYIYQLENETYPEIKHDRSQLDPNIPETGVATEDMVENVETRYTIQITFTDNDAIVTGNSSAARVEKDGAHIRIANTRSGIKYVLSGTSHNGSITIFGDKKFIMEFKDLSLINPYGPAINNQCKKTCFVVLADDTENRLEDGVDYPIEENGIQSKGAFFSEGQTIFSGNGKLDVYGHNKHGIACDDYVRIRKGADIYVNVYKHQNVSASGIKANDGIYLNGGIVNVEINSDGGKGINSEDSIKIYGGRLTVLTYGAPLIDTNTNDTTSSAGIKCNMAYVQYGGDVAIHSNGNGTKGLNSNGNIIINQGSLNVVTLGQNNISSPKGIKTDGDMTVSGGYICSYSKKASPLDVAGTLNYGAASFIQSETKKSVTIKF